MSGGKSGNGNPAGYRNGNNRIISFRGTIHRDIRISIGKLLQFFMGTMIQMFMGEKKMTEVLKRNLFFS